MKKTGTGKNFWDVYRTCSLYLIFPAICLFVTGLFSNLLDPNPERFDRQVPGVVVSCVDKTDRSRAARENNAYILTYLIKAEYQVDGTTYTCEEHWGSPKKYGDQVTVSYNSAKPSDSTLNTDPVAGKKRVGNLVVGSGIVLVLCVVPLAVEKIRKSGK